MTKTQIRNLKSHYLCRWSVMRHNQKNSDKILLLEDQFILKNLIAGPALFYNCLGQIYQDIVDLDTHQIYNNLIMINNLEFKYKTVAEINNMIQNIADQLLIRNGRILFSVDHKFLNYNRLETTVDQLLANWFINFEKFHVQKVLNLLEKENPGYGTYFFCVDYA